MIGLGTQDTYAEAKLFVTRHSLTFRMLWDSGFESWQGFSISHQPAFILATKEGTRVKTWQGELSAQDKSEVVRLARVSK